MRPTLLILGGTTEASRLARRVADLAVEAVYSYAGRVATPDRQPIDTRVGGFGGVEGLIDYLRDRRITHIVDATHPFAAQISRNVSAAATATSLPLIALTRPPWTPIDGDQWTTATDMADAVKHVETKEKRRIFLAIGRTEISAFRRVPQHHYLLRMVEPPATPPSMPDHTLVIARGPFDEASDRELIQHHEIDLVVSKNSGGAGAYAKIGAARALGLPVLMINRPRLPTRREVSEVDEVIAWLHHTDTERGV